MQIHTCTCNYNNALSMNIYVLFARVNCNEIHNLLDLWCDELLYSYSLVTVADYDLVWGNEVFLQNFI